jgi:hypothetical protein
MEVHFPQEVWLSRQLEGLKTLEVGWTQWMNVSSYFFIFLSFFF